jgi:hypothetical protein
VTDEDAEELIRVHDEIAPFFRERRFDQACEVVRGHRDRAAESGANEKASALSELLATCLTMVSRNTEALDAARRAEALAPTSTAAKLATARILLHFIDSPAEALSKTEEVVTELGPNDASRYGALSLHGTALARCGNLAGALAVFREMTSPEMLRRLQAADYVGVYDLAVVDELVKARVALDDCRAYLKIVRAVPSGWPHLERKLAELLQATKTPPN